MKPNPADHLRLVHFILKTYFSMAEHYAEYEDMFQEGSLALMKASNKFDLSYQVEFSTYASKVIIGHLQRYKRDNKIIRNARGPFKIYLQLQKLNMMNASIDEICEKFKCSELVAKRALMHQYVVISGDSPMPESDEKLTYFDSIEGEPLDYTVAEVNEFLGTLSDLERKVIELRYKDLTQLEIAPHVGISQVSVGRVLRKIGNRYYKMRAEAIAN